MEIKHITTLPSFLVSFIAAQGGADPVITREAISRVKRAINSNRASGKAVETKLGNAKAGYKAAKGEREAEASLTQPSRTKYVLEAGPAAKLDALVQDLEKLERKYGTFTLGSLPADLGAWLTALVAKAGEDTADERAKLAALSAANEAAARAALGV